MTFEAQKFKFLRPKKIWILLWANNGQYVPLCPSAEDPHDARQQFMRIFSISRDVLRTYHNSHRHVWPQTRWVQHTDWPAELSRHKMWLVASLCHTTYPVKLKNALKVALTRTYSSLLHYCSPCGQCCNPKTFADSISAWLCYFSHDETQRLRPWIFI